MSDKEEESGSNPYEAVLTFTITRKQYKEAEEFIKTHQELHGKGHSAIGGRFSYMFCSTSIGVLSEVRCACGKGISLTDLDDL